MCHKLYSNYIISKLALHKVFIFLLFPTHGSSYFSNDTSNPIILDSADPNPIVSKGFNSSLPTKVLIHGYNGSLYYEPTYKIARGE